MFTIASQFMAQAESRPHAPFLCIPPSPQRDYLPDGQEYTYEEVAARAKTLTKHYGAAGIGHGHRVAILVENRPDFFWHWIALNMLGASIVPLNPDSRKAELVYIFDLTEPDLCVTLPKRAMDLSEAIAQSGTKTPVVSHLQVEDGDVPTITRPAPFPGQPDSTSEAGLLFTSGTTGSPKACVLNNRYFVTAGVWYTSRGGRGTFRYGQERMYSTLPVNHLGGLGFAAMGMIVSGGCLIQSDRFSPRRVWADARHTGATVMHYLGVVLTTLLQMEPTEDERMHSIRFAMGGGGGDPALRKAFQDRFGVELCEGWGMTETGRTIYASHPPFHEDVSNFGRTTEGFEVRVVDDANQPVAVGERGELLVRFSGPDPRFGFFAHYLKNDEATEQAWEGGWFHTGDMVSMLADGTICFIDRKKNIIRRAGENIAAAEIESVLDRHPAIEVSSCVPIKDPIREEEVFAFVQLKDKGADGDKIAEGIFQWCQEHLAYFKAPGWICFIDTMPLTGSNKINRAVLMEKVKDPQTCEAIDLRSMKRRKAS